MLIRMRLFLLLPLLVASLAAWSFPTLYGDTGLVLMPTADVQPVSSFEGVVDFMKVSGAGKTRAIPLRLCYGISEHTELALMISEAREAEKGFDVAGAAVKMVLIDEESYTFIPGVAVGMRAIRLKQQGLQTKDVVDGYLVLSKTMLARGDMTEDGFIIRTHAGLASTTYSGGATGSFIGPFGGASYLSASGNFVGLEFMPAQKSGATTLRENTISAVLRRPLSDNFFIEVGTTRPFGMGASNTAFAGIMYRYAERSPDQPITIGY